VRASRPSPNVRQNHFNFAPTHTVHKLHYRT
jgi:hypothetical protein